MTLVRLRPLPVEGSTLMNPDRLHRRRVEGSTRMSLVLRLHLFEGGTRMTLVPRLPLRVEGHILTTLVPRRHPVVGGGSRTTLVPHLHPPDDDDPVRVQK